MKDHYSVVSICIAISFLGLAATGHAAVISDQAFFNASDTLIDFETSPLTGSTFASRTELTNQDEMLGVLFSSPDRPRVLHTADANDTSGRFEAPFKIISSVSGGGAPTSGIRYASGNTYTGTDTPDMRVDFTAGVSAFGMYVIDNDFSTARLRAYDSAGSLLETVILTQTGNGGSAYYGVDVTGTGDAISYFILDGNNDMNLDSTFIDELSYRSVAAVPVPTAFWLFGSALLGLMGIARRNKA